MTKQPAITFIDLFAGIGGFRLGFEPNGYECVFSSEINKGAIDMYMANFGDDSFCDITKKNASELPDFDILCGGFPCQAFSSAGKKAGFNDTRGTLFFDILRILKEKKPQAFVLENVKNLEKHDSGNTFKVILNSLTDLGYTVSYKVLAANDFGVPQNRERIIIVGLLNGKSFNFDNLQTTKITSMADFLDPMGDYLDMSAYTLLDNPIRQPKSNLIFSGYLNKNRRQVGVRENTDHLSRVHKQPNRIYSCEGVHPTLSAQESSGRYYISTPMGVRRLSLNECYRFMGYPENFKKIGSKTSLYRCIGNSVCVPMISEVAKELKKYLTV